MVKKIAFLSVVMALFLMTNFAGILPGTAISFTDVTENHSWAHEAISYLAEEGVITGIGDDLFAPDEQVTKEQFAVPFLEYRNRNR